MAVAESTLFGSLSSMAPSCNDPEGWNAVSSLRQFDFTPCFEEGILFSTLYCLVFLAGVIGTLSVCLSPALVDRTLKSRWLLRIKIVSFLSKAFS